MKKNQNVGFQNFTLYPSSILPDGWVELKISTCRCYFRAFQVELDILGIMNFVIGSVVEKLQAFEVGWISISLFFFPPFFFVFLFLKPQSHQAGLSQNHLTRSAEMLRAVSSISADHVPVARRVRAQAARRIPAPTARRLAQWLFFTGQDLSLDRYPVTL